MLTDKFWEKYFQVYDNLNILYPYDELLSALKDQLNIESRDVVLDVGSGTGNLLAKLKDSKAKLIGIDFSKQGLAICRIKNPEVEVIYFDITKKLPFPDNYFSKIVSNNTIYTLNFDQQNNCIREIYRILKPGGIFVVSNVKKNFSPLKIYFAHICKSINTNGFLKTLVMVVKMVIPTIKIFYYNIKIKKSGAENYYNFLDADSQIALLKSCGFKNISKTIFPYAKQAVMNACNK